MYGGENSGMPLGPDPVNNGTGTFGADNDYDQPAAIVSGGDDGGAVAFDSSNKNNNSAKYFGRRSREKAANANAAQMQVNAELAAASNIANNPNNPEFFRQAAVDNTTAKIERQPREINKKPIIIGVAAVLGIAVIALLATTVFPKLFRPYANGMTPEKISEILTNEKLDTVASFEQAIKNMSLSPMKISARTSMTKNDTFMKTLREQFGTYKEINEAISKYEAVQYREETVVYFKDAKEKMSKMTPIYEEILNRLDKTFAVIYDGASIDTISSLPGFDESLKYDIANFNKLSTLKKNYNALNCTTAQDNTAGSKCYKAREEIDTFIESFDGNSDLRKLIFSSDTVAMVTSGDYIVRKDLRAIQYAPDNKAVEEEEEKEK